MSCYLLLFSPAGLKHSHDFFFTNYLLQTMFKYMKSKLVLLCDIRLNVNVTDDTTSIQTKTTEVMKLGFLLIHL